MVGREGRHLQRGVDDARDVAAGEEPDPRALLDGLHRNRNRRIDAAGASLRFHLADLHLDRHGAIIAAGEGLEAADGLRFAEIAVGAGIFLAVDGIVERTDESCPVGAVVDIGDAFLCQSLAIQRCKCAESEDGGSKLHGSPPFVVRQPSTTIRRSHSRIRYRHVSPSLRRRGAELRPEASRHGGARRRARATR
ncbi:hypothetical protein D9M72_565530 [compost metagenome]